MKFNPSINFKNMRYLIAAPGLKKRTLGLLLAFISVVADVSGQIETVFVMSPEFDSRSTFSLKAGVSNVFTQGCGKYCAKMYYNQIQAKYNFTNEAVGLQTAFGFSHTIIGGRLGLDYEYIRAAKTHDFMPFITAGLDIGGAASLQFGPKFNSTQKSSSKDVMLMIVLDLPVALFFQKGEIQKAIQSR